MKKELKRWGNNLVIVFTQEDERTYGLREKDILDIGDMLIETKKKEVKK